jgi:hypothetical protein
MYVTLELEPRIDIFICFCAELQPTNYRESWKALCVFTELNMEQYSILGRIGEGAHGIVLKAKHIEVM